MTAPARKRPAAAPAARRIQVRTAAGTCESDSAPMKPFPVLLTCAWRLPQANNVLTQVKQACPATLTAEP